ncbi:hypothetical protein EZS27_004074 [termite gut metagenome]|uniref:Uncharacterized protein n=1 Tax=termite gut metagenome TaxID=433724 RepID=A0A5J4SQN3_9ZZZZ
MKTTLAQIVNNKEDGETVIEQHPRSGWAEASMRMHENDGDKLLMPDVFKDETFDEIQWKND